MHFANILLPHPYDPWTPRLIAHLEIMPSCHANNQSADRSLLPSLKRSPVDASNPLARLADGVGFFGSFKSPTCRYLPGFPYGPEDLQPRIWASGGLKPDTLFLPQQDLSASTLSSNTAVFISGRSSVVIQAYKLFLTSRFEPVT